MEKITPKNVPDDAWQKLDAKEAYAVRAFPEDNVFLLLGQGRAVYLMISANHSGGRDVFELDFESGQESLLGRITLGDEVAVGRTSETPIKIQHAIVSRKHLEIKALNNSLILRDLGSTNGTSCYKPNKCFNIDRFLTGSWPDSKGIMPEDVKKHFGNAIDEALSAYTPRKEK